MKRILSMVLCLVMVLSVFAGCGEQTDPTQTTAHKHTYSKTWSADESGHWYAADCGHELKINQGEHMDEDADGVCDICAWADASCQHTFDETTYMTDETSHWYGATCNHYGAVKDKADHTDEDNDGACDVCAYTGDHTHSFANDWSSDEKQHWHEATCGHAVKNGVENHMDFAMDGVCDVCGWFDASHSHTFSSDWAFDVTYHWHGATCEHTGALSDKAEHVDADSNTFCDVCNYEICIHEDYNQDGKCDFCGWSDPSHSHTFGDLASDKTHHWQIATCHPGAISEKEAHIDANKDGVCDTCQFQICGHSFADEWTSDDTHHWKAILCTCNIPRKDYAEHTLDDKGVCTECMYGYVVESVCEVLIDKKPFTIEFEATRYVFCEFTVSFPQAGRYVLYPSHEEVKIADVPILDSEKYPMPTDQARTIEVDEACEKTYYFYMFVMNGFEPFMEVPITYSLVRIDDVVVDTLKGKVELPTNTLYKLKFSAPEVGEYKLITSVEGLDIGLTEDSMEYFKGHISFAVEEVGQEFTFYIKVKDLERESFIFDWILEPPFCQNIDKEGNYPVSVAPNQVDYKIQFTAPEAGYYALNVDSNWLTFCYWNETHKQPVRGDGDLLEMQQVLTGWLEAGEVYTTWLQTVYNYPDSVTCKDTLTITNIGQLVELGESTVTPGAEGGKYTVVANETAYYCLSVENGQIGIIGATGAISWVDSYEVKVLNKESYSFMLRGDGEVKLNIVTKQYEVKLEEGSNTVNMVPNKEYNISFGQYHLLNADDTVSETLADIDLNSIVKLYWTNPNVMVFVDGAEIAVGAEIELMHLVSLCVMVRGREATDVELTVEVANPKHLDQQMEGEQNAILQMHQQATLLINGNLNPATATFTADGGGTFTLDCQSDVTVNVYIKDANGVETFLFSTDSTNTYTFHLDAGETITFVVKVPGETAVNAYLTVSNR